VSPCQRYRGRFFFDQQRTFQTQLVLFYVHAAACVFCRAGTPRDLNPQNVSTNYISKRSIRLQEEHPTTRGASDYKRSIRLQEEHPTTRGAPIPRTISYTPFQPHPLANYVYIYRYTCIYTYIFTAFYLVFFCLSGRRLLFCNLVLTWNFLAKFGKALGWKCSYGPWGHFCFSS
jgi:hypothetical protein